MLKKKICYPRSKPNDLKSYIGLYRPEYVNCLGMNPVDLFCVILFNMMQVLILHVFILLHNFSYMGNHI